MLAAMVALSGYGLSVPAHVRCGLPGAVGCPGGVLGPAFQPAGAGVQWFDIVLYDWGFWIVDATTGTNETNSWNVFEGWTVHVNATSQAPTVAIGGTAYHGLGVEINATGEQLLSLAAPVGKWVSASFVAPAAEYHHQHLWCTIECGPGHGSQQTWVLNVVPPSIFPVPTASANVTAGSAPLSVAFFGNATLGTPPYNFTWDFGDGSANAYGTSAAHVYALGGVYFARLTVSDAKGYDGTATVTETVLSGAPLTASISASTLGPYAPTLANLSVTAHGGLPPYTYAWDYGDGAAGAGPNATSHAYWSPGLYAVLVIVTDSAGAAASAIATVDALPPTGPLSVTVAASPLNGTAPLVTTLNASAPNATAPSGFLWDLGDGRVASGASVTPTFNSSGAYEVRVFAVDGQGRVGEATQLVSVTPAVLTGGGGSDDGGGTDLLPAVSAAVSSASVLLSVAPSAGPVPLTVLATASVVGGSGTNETASWTFGDGTQGTGQVVSHAYSAEGSYRISVVVHDSSGATASASALVVAGGPAVRVVENATAGDAPFGVLAAASVTGGSGTYGTLRWDWGDGSTSIGNVSGHLYPANLTGHLTIRATVNDSAGAPGNGSSVVVIYPPPTATVAVLLPSSGGLPVSVGLSVVLHGGSGVAARQALWTYGDGTSGRVGPSTSHAYGSFGHFLVTVSTTDTFGRAANASAWVNLSLNLSLPKTTGPTWSLTGVPDPSTAALGLLGMVGATGLLLLVRRRSGSTRAANARRGSKPAPPPRPPNGPAP